MEESLTAKQSKEMEELYNYLEQKLPKQVKYSKYFLDFKSQEENLVKQQRFKEAVLIKKKLDSLNKIDSEKFNKDKYEKIKSQSVKTANKHMNEKNSLRKKIEIEYEVMKKEKQVQLEKLLLKYKNRKTELENQQRQEMLYIEKERLLKASKWFIDWYLFYYLYFM